MVNSVNWRRWMMVRLESWNRQDIYSLCSSLFKSLAFLPLFSLFSCSTHSSTSEISICSPASFVSVALFDHMCIEWCCGQWRDISRFSRSQRVLMIVWTCYLAAIVLLGCYSKLHLSSVMCKFFTVSHEYKQKALHTSRAHCGDRAVGISVC